MRTVRHGLDLLPLESVEATVKSQPRNEIPIASFMRSIFENRASVLAAGSVSATVVEHCLAVLGEVRASTLDDAGREWQSRSIPSAGGTHCLEPLVDAWDVSGMRSGLYRQDGRSMARLQGLTGEDINVLRVSIVDALRGQSPSAVVYAICDPAQIASRYPHGTSLMWRDAGAFLMTAHLIAASFGFSSTIVGACEVLPRQLVPDDQIELFMVGAVALGGEMKVDCDD